MLWSFSSSRHALLIPANQEASRRMGFGFARHLRPGSSHDHRRGDHKLPRCYWKDYDHVARAPFPMCFTREALENLLRSVGNRYPESGAKGFGPKDRMGFDVVEFDRRGSSFAHGVMYAPDVEWGESRRIHHLTQPDENMRLWTGDAHSHPGHMGTPSRRSGHGLGDLGYAQLVFEENEWMEWFMLPILTGTGSGEVTLHPWVIHRFDPERPMIADGVELCEPDQFPERSFNPVWLAQQDERREEVVVLDDSPVIRHHQVFRPPSELEALELEYTRRLAGVVSPQLREARILVVGLGAGSHMVEKLARLAPAELTLCDLDVVEIPNLARTVYTVDDALARRPKVEAMASRLLEINPLVAVRTCDRDITKLDRTDMDRLFAGVDLVIAGTDQFEAQATINAEAVDRGIPAVFIGIHRDGFGGRVVGYLPGETGCYCCAAPERYALHDQGGQASLDLHGAVGSIVDSQFVDMVAAKLVLGILERGREGHAGGFLHGLHGRTDVIVRCDPRYDHGRSLWDLALSDLDGDQSSELHAHMLFAMDTVWLDNAPRSECPVCSPAAMAVMEELEVTEPAPPLGVEAEEPTVVEQDGPWFCAGLPVLEPLPVAATAPVDPEADHSSEREVVEGDQG